MKYKVSVIKCHDYDEKKVYDAISSSIELLGGMKNFVRQGNRVALKVNMLRGAEPKEAITTHPAVVSGVARLVQEAGGEPFIVDSPGSGLPYVDMILKGAYKTCGYEEISQKLGIPLNYDTSWQSVQIPEGYLIKRMDCITPVINADLVINLPKAKTHVYMFMTGAVKNLFGVLPGFGKPGFHSKLKETHKFALMLLDIMNFVKPKLTVMDAIEGMEGDGPAAGNPRKIGAILAGTNPPALDVTLCKIIRLAPDRVPTNKLAGEKGIGPKNEDEIELAGDPLENIAVENFALPKSLATGDGFDLLLSPFQSIFRSQYANFFTLRPVVKAHECKRCGICIRACPEHAINILEGKAIIDDKKCIRCYCCHEMCPHKAIELQQSIFNRLIRMVSP